MRCSYRTHILILEPRFRDVDFLRILRQTHGWEEINIAMRAWFVFRSRGVINSANQLLIGTIDIGEL